MKKRLTYDLPVRIFHWAFAALFISSFVITKTIDDDDPIFSYHMLAGLILLGLVLLRILWGFVGTHYSRFTSFALCPSELIKYLKGILTGDKKKWAGHNPASSWASLLMFTSALALAITGVLMTSGYKEDFEDIHEIITNIFLITALLHIAGVLIHNFRHQDGIALAMIHGKKSKIEKNTEVISQRPLSAIALVLLMSVWTGFILKNYNTETRELTFLGKNLTLGESKNKDLNNDNDDDDND